VAGEAGGVGRVAAGGEQPVGEGLRVQVGEVARLQVGQQRALQGVVQVAQLQRLVGRLFQLGVEALLDGGFQQLGALGELLRQRVRIGNGRGRVVQERL
jgi:hypothetical protein